MPYLQNKLKEIMKSKNLTQVDLAKLANVSQNTISNWLNNTSSPNIKNLDSLAKSLGLTVGDLIGDFGKNFTDDEKRFLALTAKQKKILLKFMDFLEEIKD